MSFSSEFASVLKNDLCLSRLGRSATPREAQSARPSFTPHPGRALAALVPPASLTSEQPDLRPVTPTFPTTLSRRWPWLTRRVGGGAASLRRGLDSLAGESGGDCSSGRQPFFEPFLICGLVTDFLAAKS